MDNPLDDLYQDLILDHNRSPRNFRVMPDANSQAEGDNPLCGDHFTVFLKLDQNRIADVAFQGAGCAISKASASLMTEAVKGKTVEEARKHFAEFQQMLAKGDAAKHEETLGNLCALGGVHKFPMRVKCAVLSWHALMAGLGGRAGSAETK